MLNPAKTLMVVVGRGEGDADLGAFNRSAPPLSVTGG